MYQYMSPNFIVLDETLISYTGNQPVAKIPGMVENIHPIRVISEKSIGCNPQTTEVVLPDTVKVLHKDILQESSNVRSLTIPFSLEEAHPQALSGIQEGKITLSMNRGDYDTICQNGFTLFGAEVLIQPSDLGECGKIFTPLFFKGCCYGKKLWGDEYLGYEIREDYNYLFSGAYGLVEPATLSVPQESINLRKGMEWISEESVIRKLIEGKLKVYINPKCEAESDWDHRTNSDLMARILPFLYGIRRYTPEPNKVLLECRIACGCRYFPSVKRVVYQGNDYWIYRRCFLQGEGGYMPRDIAVYNSSCELITDEPLIEAVYGKYKLLTLL